MAQKSDLQPVTVEVRPHITGSVVSIVQGDPYNETEVVVAPDDVDRLIEELKLARDEARAGS